MAGTVVICFTDIVESTELLTTLGDEAFDDVPPGRLGRHDRGVWAETRRLVPAATAPYWG